MKGWDSILNELGVPPELPYDKHMIVDPPPELSSSEKVSRGIAHFLASFPDFPLKMTFAQIRDFKIGSSNLHPVALITGIDWNVSLYAQMQDDIDGLAFNVSHGLHSTLPQEDEEELDQEWKDQVTALRIKMLLEQGKAMADILEEMARYLP